MYDFGIYFLIFFSLVISLIIFINNINKIFPRYKNIFSKRNKYFLIILLIILFFCTNELWLHFHDEYKLLKYKLSTIYIFKSFIPIQNKLKHDNIKIKLPYGYSLINKYSALSIWGPQIENISKELDYNGYEYIEQLGSSSLWRDNKKLIFVTCITRGRISFIFINTKDIEK